MTDVKVISPSCGSPNVSHESFHHICSVISLNSLQPEQRKNFGLDRAGVCLQCSSQSGLPDFTKILGQTVISAVKKTKKTKGKYAGKK